MHKQVNDMNNKWTGKYDKIATITIYANTSLIIIRAYVIIRQQAGVMSLEFFRNWPVFLLMNKARN